MEWEVFTLEDERLKILGQEISSDIGRRILALLKERLMSPNDLAKELGLPITTVIFHIEKLQNAGLIRPVARISGKRGQKTLYTLASSAFIIMTSSEERDRIYEALRMVTAAPKEILVKGALIGLLIGVLMLFPWYLFTMNTYSEQIPELSPSYSTQNATGPLIKGLRYPNESIAEVSRYEDRSALIFIILGISASIVSAVVTSFMISRKSRKYEKSEL
ncbi:MAG: winged helix-turn-helix domain-containing protein [Candidatus Korarchaeum sp.]|jgi:DNA-binding Lrp family transcriptional regulator|nr:winged helix-turn-helix domain-containing protein [Candidatus Korarchaeum sp.]